MSKSVNEMLLFLCIESTSKWMKVMSNVLSAWTGKLKSFCHAHTCTVNSALMNG